MEYINNGTPLTEGDNIMLADFGTAFDWTEAENEVTIGPPDAYTKLYVAPEVSYIFLRKSRNGRCVIMYALLQLHTDLMPLRRLGYSNLAILRLTFGHWAAYSSK
jgi:hypothetical protein